MILPILFNGLWEGAPILAMAYLFVRATPSRNASTRYAIWMATLAALALVPVVTTIANVPLLLDAFRARAPQTAFVITLLPTKPFVQHAGAWLGSLGPWLLGAWLAGVALNLLRLSASLVRVNRIRRNARPAAGVLAGILVSEDVSVPIVAGVLVPAIVLPQTLVTELAPANLARIIAHERAHVERNDSLFNLCARLIEAWLFFNPWVRLAGSRIRCEREVACDDWVVEKTGSAGEYAACLAALAWEKRMRNVPLLTPSVLGSKHALVARIERLGSNEPRRLTLNFYTIGGSLMISTVMAIALGAVAPAFALTPALAGVERSSATLVAASCSQPNAEAKVVTPAEPILPHGSSLRGTVNVIVTISAGGRVVSTTVAHSSGNAGIDAAVVVAAKHSTYLPKRMDCNPVEGTYVFRAEFAPGP